MAGPCVSDSLANYIGLDPTGCTIGGVQFTDFQLGFAIYPEIDPSIVTLTPTTFPGFLVTLNTSQGAGEVVQSAFSFVAAGMQFGQGGVGLIDSAVAGDGVNTALVIISPDFLVPAVGASIAFDAGFDASFFESTTFPPLGSIFVELEFVVDGGLSGSASLAQGEVRLGGVVPEPSSWALMGSGAFGVIWLHRRRSIGRRMNQGGEA